MGLVSLRLTPPQGDTPARRTRAFPRHLAQPLRPAAVLEAFRRGLEGEASRAKLHHRDSQDSGVASEVSSASRYSFSDGPMVTFSTGDLKWRPTDIRTVLLKFDRYDFRSLIFLAGHWGRRRTWRSRGCRGRWRRCGGARGRCWGSRPPTGPTSNWVTTTMWPTFNLDNPVKK